ncbi:MAG: TolC family protein [Bacteroidales bacterium]
MSNNRLNNILINRWWDWLIRKPAESTKRWQKITMGCVILMGILFIFNTSFLLGQEIVELNQCWQKLVETHQLSSNRQIIDDIGKLKLKNTERQWYPQLGLTGQATYQSDAISLNLLLPDPATQPVTFTRRSIESPRDQYKLYLDVQQPLYLGGSRRYAVSNSITASQIEQYRNEIDLRKLMEQVNSLYFQILLIRKKQQMGSLMLSTLKEKEKSVSAAIRNGVLQKSDIDAIRVEILKVRQSIIEYSLLLEGLYANLNELTGINATDSTHFLPPAVDIFDSLPGKKLEELSLEAQQSMLENIAMITAARRRPTVVAFAQAGYGRPALNMLSTSFEPYYILGITFRWSIFDWNSNRNEQQQIMLQKQIVEHQQSTFMQNIRMACRLSQSRIQQLTESLRTDSAIVELRSNITRRAASKLDKGVITANEYLGELNAEHQSRIQLETDAILWMQEKVNYYMLKGTIESLVLQKDKR